MIRRTRHGGLSAASYGLGIVMLVMMLLIPRAGSAQGVLGTVVDRTGQPLSGVVVMLLDSAQAVVTRSLTNARGEYRFAVSVPGSYRLRALRIGFQPVVSDMLSLHATSAATVRLVLDGVHVQLAAMRVTGKNSCERQSDNEPALKGAWEQAVGSMATVALGSTQGLTATIMQIEQELDASGKRVRLQSASMRTANLSQPWRSAPVEMLHSRGYVWALAMDSVIYNAPGLDVFLSSRFLEDHCLRPALAVDTTEFGVAFEPTPERRHMSEVRGILWLSRATAELLRMEFTFVNVPGQEDRGIAAGGAIAFAHVKGGSVIVTGWEIRMPHITRTEGQPTGARVTTIASSGGRTAVMRRGTDTLYRSPTIVVEGIVRSAASKATIAGATLQLAGTAAHAVSDAAGQFLFHDVLPGQYALVARTPALDSLGITHSMELVVTEGLPAVTVAIPTNAQAAAGLCPPMGRDSAGRVQGSVVGIVRAGNDTTAHVGIAVVAEWSSFSSSGSSTPTVQQRAVLRETRTDERGAFRLCGVPMDRALAIRALPARGESNPVPVRLSGDKRVATVVLQIDVKGQTMTTFTDTVADTGRRGLADVEVAIPALALATRTDARGQFRLADAPVGMHVVVVRREGYEGITTSVVLEQNQNPSHQPQLPRAARGLGRLQRSLLFSLPDTAVLFAHHYPLIGLTRDFTLRAVE